MLAETNVDTECVCQQQRQADVKGEALRTFLISILNSIKRIFSEVVPVWFASA